MKCGDPVLVYNRAQGGRVFRHWSLSNDLFKSMAQMVFNCGTCPHCRKRRAFELACRCVLHASLYKENCFLTLTYDESKDGYHNNFQYKDIQDFKKRLRQHCWRKHAKRIDLFNVHEYGANGKKHWHLICFNHDFADKTLYTKRKGIPYYTSETLSELWPFGFNNIGDVTEASAMYQSQYMEKDLKHDYVTSSKKSHSKHSGLGKPYFQRHYAQMFMLGWVPFHGRKMPLPRYFQRLGHRHYSHFYEPSNFFDNRDRKAIHRPFRKLGPWTPGTVDPDIPNPEIADLFIHYRKLKESYIQDLEAEWDGVISQYLTTKEDPDFMKSLSNFVYDLRNKNKQEEF